MQWKKNHHPPKPTHVWVWRFAFLPVRITNELTVWLEWYEQRGDYNGWENRAHDRTQAWHYSSEY